MLTNVTTTKNEYAELKLSKQKKGTMTQIKIMTKAWSSTQACKQNIDKMLELKTSIIKGVVPRDEEHSCSK